VSRQRQHRIAIARALAIVFLLTFLWHLWQAPTRHNLVFYASTVLYLGLAVLYYAIAREESRQ
jgi:uncharacterized membrane protein